MALECAGYILSLQPQALVATFLNSVLVPRLTRVGALCEGGSAQAQPMSKTELLFEISVVSSLVKTLEAPAQTEQGPVLAVMEQSLPLFSGLVQASGNDAEVGEKIAACLKGALLGLSDAERGEALVPSILRLLSQIFPPLPAAFIPAKQLCILYGSNPTHVPALRQLLHHWSQPQLLLGKDGKADIEAVEGVLGLASAVLKRHPALLSEAIPNLLRTSTALIGDPEDFAEAPAVKAAAMFVTGTLSGPVSLDPDSVEFSALLGAAITRIRGESLTSSVEYVADILLLLLSQHPLRAKSLLPHHQLPSEELQLFHQMFSLLGKKRKFREMAKRINLLNRQRRA